MSFIPHSISGNFKSVFNIGDNGLKYPGLSYRSGICDDNIIHRISDGAGNYFWCDDDTNNLNEVHVIEIFITRNVYYFRVNNKFGEIQNTGFVNDYNPHLFIGNEHEIFVGNSEYTAADITILDLIIKGCDNCGEGEYIEDNIQNCVNGLTDCDNIFNDITSFPSKNPTKSPSITTLIPTSNPTKSPSNSPSKSPNESPSKSPSYSPSVPPSLSPNISPSTSPSTSPTQVPSKLPSKSPSTSPSETPSKSPSKSPSQTPTTSPSISPSQSPSIPPSKSPSTSPSASPSQSPTKTPTQSPNKAPTQFPTTTPSTSPTQFSSKSSFNSFPLNMLYLSK